MTSIRLRDILKEKELVALLLLVGIYFARPLFLGETFFYRDLYLLFYPQRERLAEFLQSGILPLWDPYLHGGQPFLGEIANMTLQPTVLLYLFLPPLTAFNLEVVLYVLFSAAGTYAFARVIGMHPPAALLAAILFAFNGMMLSRINLMPGLIAAAYMPPIFLFWHLYLQQGKKKWFALTAAFGAFQMITGVPDVAGITWITLLGWSLFWNYEGRTARRKLFLWLLLLVIVAGLSCIQLLPTAEMVLLSSRGQGLGIVEVSQWSLHPKRLPEVVIPGFFGDTNGLTFQTYWGFPLEDVYPPYFASLYLGIPALLLTFSVVFVSDYKPIPIYLKRFLFAVTGLSIALALGRFLPTFQFLYSWIPVLNVLRFPVKFYWGAILPVCILAAATFDAFFNTDNIRPRLKALLWTAGVTGIVITGFVILYTTTGYVAGAFERFFFGRQLIAEHRDQLGNSMVHTMVATLLFAALSLYRALRPTGWLKWGVVGIVGMDVMIAGLTVNPYAPRTFFNQEPSIVKILNTNIGKGRLFSDPIANRFQLTAPSNDIMWVSRWQLEVLGGYSAFSYGIPVVFHSDYDGLAPFHVRRLGEVLKDLPWEKRLPVLSAAGVTLILTEDQVQLAGIIPLARIRNQSNVDFILYKNQKALPHAKFVSSATQVTSFEEAVQRITDPSFNPEREVVLQNTSPKASAGTECDPGSIEYDETGTIKQSLTIKTQCGGYIVLTENHYPGWRYYLNGKRTKTIRANGAFTAISVPAGTHRLQRSYVPLSLIAGASITFTFLLFLAALPLLVRK